MSVPVKLSSVFKWLLFLLFGLAALGQLQRVELPMARAIYLHEAVMVIFIMTAFIAKVVRGIKVPLSWRVFGLWILISIVFMAMAGMPVLAPILYLVRFAAYLLFGLVLVQLVKNSEIKGHFVRWCLTFSFAAVALLGWLQYFYLPDTRGLVFLGWDDHYLRLISTFFDPGFTGIILTLGALLLQNRLLSWKGKLGWEFGVHQWIWLITVGALLFTYSRASFLAFAAGCVCLWLFSRKNRHLMVLAFFAFSILILPRGRSEGVRLERTASITSRVESYKQATPESLPQTLFGSGWYSQKSGTLRLVGGNLVSSHNSAPDNSFLFIFSSLGLVGLVLFLWLIRDLAALGKSSALTLASLAGISVHALFSNSFFYPFVLLYLAGILALQSSNSKVVE